MTINRLTADKLRLLKERPVSIPATTLITNQVLALNKEKSQLQARVEELLSDLGYCIAQINISQKDWFVFDCDHDHHNTVPGGYLSAWKPSPYEVVNDLVKAYVDAKDDDFLKAYQSSREAMIQNHRAYEQSRQGLRAVKFLRSRMSSRQLIGSVVSKSFETLLLRSS